MNYFIESLLNKSTEYYLEITILVIIGIILVLSIILLTIIKKIDKK